ncbi:MAG: hypothetical protein AB8B49_04565 [Nitratireductor sp.]
MGYNIAFSPQLPISLIGLILGITLLFVLWGLLTRLKGALIRALGWSLLAIALFNPSLLIEEREAIKSIVAIVSDKSASQKLNGREAQTNLTVGKIKQDLAKLDTFEVREIEVTDQISNTSDVSTALFAALQNTIKDVPSSQLAGAIFVTDGQVHDIPKALNELGINAPIHALITGVENEKDRQIKILEAPRYGVVGESYEISYLVSQEGFSNNQDVLVSIFIDGELITQEPATPGQVSTFFDDVRHGGKNIIELRVEEAADEITTTNNQVFTTLNGIRENLRVLLVSGEPHVGERTWRNLLKSDASVDLVHFTILRPPEKQDGTPINQLSLIAFPTRELFIQKIDEFDLIIFDRYSRRGVLPMLYFDNIARYVRDGGAILIAAGPEYGVAGSIAQTPLSDVLSALPTGKMRQGPYKPRVSKTGQKHPVTRSLNNAQQNGDFDNPKWSNWFRSISVDTPSGEVVLKGVEDDPLLILERFDEGRVALLLSDHAWLWARGYEGGGPHLQLLRRISHWLMKEPELEEERLAATSDGNTLFVQRQTLEEQPLDTIITTPSGKQITLSATSDDTKENGIFAFETKVDEIGLYQISNGDLQTLTHVGKPNPREFSQVLSTTALLEPIIEQSRGQIQRVSKDATNVPRILSVNQGASAKGNAWIGLEDTKATLLKGIDRVSLFSGFFGLALLLLAFAGLWTREGR